MTSYSTTFPLAENPISEGGKWINGGVVGLDWYNAATTPGRAHGVQSTSNPAYCDPTALLAGTWGPEQTAEGTVYCDNPTSSYYQEVELRLRSTLSAHRATGYEIMYRCLKTSDGYTYIARWNGALGDFKIIGGQGGVGVSTGDVVKATIVGNTITAYINGVQVAQAQDNTFAQGSPGIGFNYGVGPTFADFGFTRFRATAQ
jgi:hypothetical protein